MGIETSVLVAYAAVASAAVGAGAAIYSGEQQRKAANAQADQVNADAQAAAQQAQVDAQRIRDATRKRQGEAVAALAASGVDVASGTAEKITSDIGYRGEQDALMTILSGQNGVARSSASADAIKISGDNAETAGYLNATSTVLNSASRIGNKWTGTQKPAVQGGS